MEPSKPPTIRQLRMFGALWLPLALLLVARSAREPMVVKALVGGAIVAFVVALVYPRAYRPVFVLLMRVTAPIGYVVSRLLLAVVFFVVVTPLALWRRRRGDVLGVRFDRDATTYWKDRRRGGRSVASYFRQDDE